MSKNKWIAAIVPALTAVVLTNIVWAQGEPEPVEVNVGDSVRLWPVPEPEGDYDITVTWTWDEAVFSGPETMPYETDEPLELEAVAPGSTQVIADAVVVLLAGEDVPVEEVEQHPGWDVAHQAIRIRIEGELLITIQE